jgi:putative (di)nucleoside polyphosphate hydrolase
MPQGGIDPGEEPYPAALRELYEETNIRSVEKLGELAEWIAYDIPRDIVGEAWGGKYRGQKQKWFALRFTGQDREINVAAPGGGHHKPEFIDWRWVELKSLPDLVVPFKRQAYETVVNAFANFAKG